MTKYPELKDFPGGGEVTVYPSVLQAGTLVMPGDKSISHRTAILSALGKGTSTISGYLHSEDCLNTLRAMEMLGAQVNFGEGELIRITGTAGTLHAPEGVLNLGNSGTGMRLLAGLLAGQPFDTVLTGDSSLCSRPMGRIKAPLEGMGCLISLSEKGCAPMTIHAAKLHGIDYIMPVASAQIKSAILLGGLFADGEISVTDPGLSRDHTECLFQELGIPLTVEGHVVRMTGCGARGPVIEQKHWNVPGDISSAAFFAVAAAISGHAAVTISNVGLNPRRDAVLHVLERMGAKIERVFSNQIGEPAGDVHITGAALHGTTVGGAEIPALIDEIPVIAVAAACASGDTIIRDAKELRVKESDRISLMVKNLRMIGVDVDEQGDGMIIHGRPQRGLVPSGSVDSEGDHRIAMSMAILALQAEQPVVIKNALCTATSYPGFWDDLRLLGVRIDERN
ncbi:MAG: 3-phosphoshikimate 1-carboxyvinyltransferase [Spartobacteria bacterium]|nr:3-phosphoshikimate 1-carboxyvinyltransferase [Spartobacteria bacterium]